jgi:hypothetical protein
MYSPVMPLLEDDAARDLEIVRSLAQVPRGQVGVALTCRPTKAARMAAKAIFFTAFTPSR